MAKKDKPFRGGEKCYWCGRALLGKDHPSGLAATRDHVIAKSKGGNHKVWACRACNSLKADMSLRRWGDFMAANPEWWTLFQGRAPRRFSPAMLRNGMPKITP